MKKTFVFIIVIAMIFIGCKGKTDIQQQPNRAKVVFLQGSAYKSTDNKNWVNITINEEFEAPIFLKTDKKSILKVALWEKTTFTLYADTFISLTTLDPTKINIEMKKGSIINSIEQLKGRIYSCKTPAISAGVRGTVFKIQTDGKKDILIVEDGKVWVKRNIDKAPEIIVEKGKRIVVTIDENEKLKEKTQNMKEEEAKKLLEIQTEEASEDIINEEIKKQEEYIEKESKKQEEFIEKKSKSIEELTEKKSQDIEKTVEKKEKDIEEMMNKDINNMDELLKKAKEKRQKK